MFPTEEGVFFPKAARIFGIRSASVLVEHHAASSHLHMKESELANKPMKTLKLVLIVTVSCLGLWYLMIKTELVNIT